MAEPQGFGGRMGRALVAAFVAEVRVEGFDEFREQRDGRHRRGGFHQKGRGRSGRAADLAGFAGGRREVRREPGGGRRFVGEGIVRRVVVEQEIERVLLLEFDFQREIEEEVG